jgi:hypothetical protein
MTPDIKHISHSQFVVSDSSSQTSNDTTRLLEQEILLIEEELRNIEFKIRGFESQIQARYHNEIVRIRELASRYKKQKLLKKEKRLDQKKRGKNYREPTSLKKQMTPAQVISAPDTDDIKEIKKLYREAVLKVHPDKFANHNDEISKRSQELTIQLIDIYQSGDLKELKTLYHHIMSGNAMSENLSDETNVPDPLAMREYLIKKRDDLIGELNRAKGSRLYEVLTTYNEPSKFIDELAAQLIIRIKQLERRTRC